MTLLRIRDVSKSFGGLKAVDRVSLDLSSGEILGVIGPNGAGKTTLFGLISGFHSPDEGSIVFLDRSIVGLQPHVICQLGLTRTFQIVKPFANLSVLHNVMVGAFNRIQDKKAAQSRAEQILEFVGLGGKKHYPAKTLNIAELKRLEIAKALATQPKLLLLDEVMAGINEAEQEELMTVIRQIRQDGITIMMIGHEIQAVLRITDRLVVINFGEKIAEGRPRDVICEPEVVEAYLGEGYELVGA